MDYMRIAAALVRDKYERSFGGAHVILFRIALIELLSLLAYYFHRSHEYAARLREVPATLAGGSSMVVMSGVGAQLSRLGPALRAVAVVFIEQTERSST